jgi:hypothetical protein
MMAGGTVEATLEAWASSLRDVKGRIRPLFQQKRTLWNDQIANVAEQA